jgi:hypothetical protein
MSDRLGSAKVVPLDRARQARSTGRRDRERPPVDPARVGRRKAIALTEPLHDLQDRRAALGFEAYDLLGLALLAVEIVATRMRVDRGIDRDSLETILADEAARHAPEAPGSEHTAVSRRIVDELTERGTTTYRDADDIERRWDFVLLSEHSSGDEIYLRASNQAINLLIGALSTDIESAAIAAEAATRALIDSGNYSGARERAMEARLRSIQFANEVRALIADTKSDLRRAGWDVAKSDRLATMLAFLKERLTVETGILHGMTGTLADAQQPEIRDAAVELIATIGDCLERHRELHAYIVEAETAFRVEQDRQVFTRAASLRAVDLAPELVEPALRLPVRDVQAVLAAFTRGVLGPTAPARPSLGGLLETLLRPIAERDELGERRSELEFIEEPVSPWTFEPATYEAAERVLSGLGVARRLSELMREARRAGGEEVVDLVRLQAVLAFGGGEVSRLSIGETILASVDDGALLDVPGYGGSDLLVGELVPDRTHRTAVGEALEMPPAQLTWLARRRTDERAEAAR